MHSKVNFAIDINDLRILLGTPKQLRFSVPVSPESMNAESPDYVDMDEESEDPIPTDECLLELQRPPLKSTRERSPTPERCDSIVRAGLFFKTVTYYSFNN